MSESTPVKSSAAGEASGAGAFRRTLFIVMDSGTAIRNVLRTGIFQTLRETPGLQIVIFSPITDAAFRQEFEAPNVVVEPNVAWEAGPWVSFLRSIRREIWAERSGLFTFQSKRKIKSGHWLRSLVTGALLRGRSPERMDEMIGRLERREAANIPPLGAEYFEKYRPDLVFYTTIFSPKHCVEIGAQQRGIPTVAFVLSWDNLTSKGPFVLQPSRVVLWNDILRAEVIAHHRFQPEHILVSGIPQFDIYNDREKLIDRAAFFAKWRLDPARKLITYTTGTPGTAPFDREVLDLFYTAMHNGAFRQPVQLLVRLHPSDRPEDYQRLEGKPGLTFQRPGRASSVNARDWNPTREDMYGLAETMRHSDVVINVASTITIDAAAFDTPVVNIAYDGYKNKPYELSCQRYYKYEHYERIVRTGGVKVAYTPEETVKFTQAYLDDPTQDAAGREKIRQEQCWKLDGGAGRRIAAYLLELMEKKEG